MKAGKPEAVSSAEATTVTKNSLPTEFDLQDRPAIRLQDMPPDGSNPEHVLRIAQKMREGGSWTADFITCVKQSSFASRPRSNTLTKLIASIKKNKPGIKTSELPTELKKHAGDGVIESVSDEEIEWVKHNGKVETTKICNLKNFISSAEKLLKESESD